MIEALVTLLVIPVVAFLLGYRQHHPSFTAMMVIYGLIVAIAIVICVPNSIVGGDTSVVYLGGSDGEEYFSQAQILVHDGIFNFQSIRSNYLGYQFILAAAFVLFSSSLTTGLIVNATCLMGAIACVYRATALLTQSQRAALLAALAFMLTTAHIFYALVLTKEPPLTLAFALILLAVVKMFKENKIGAKAILYVILALALIISMRATALLFLGILFAFVGIQLLRKRTSLAVAFIALVVLIAPFAQQFTTYELNTEFLVTTVTENEVISSRLDEGDIDMSGITGRITTVYLGLPFIERIPLFIVPTLVQLLLPFDVWSKQFLSDHPAFLFFKNLNILWFTIVLPWLLYSLMRLKGMDLPLLTRFFLAGTAYFIVVAIIYGGLIPRYGAQALIFMYPSIGYWWDRSRGDAIVGRSSSRFFILYYAVAIAAALGYLALQMAR